MSAGWMSGLAGRVVHDAAGMVLGSVRTVLVDPVSAAPHWLVVEGHTFIGARAVPLARLRESRGVLRVLVTLEATRRSPPVHADRLSAEEERVLLAYWDRHRFAGGSPTARRMW